MTARVQRGVKFILIIALFAIGPGLPAQDVPDPRNGIRLGLNAATFLENSVSGIGCYAEFSHQLRPNLAMVPRLFGASGYARFGSAARFTPIPALIPRLKIDIGIAYDRITDRSQLGSDPSMNDPAVHSLTANKIGICGSLGMGIIESDRMDSGLRTDILTSFVRNGLAGDIVQAGIYMGIRF
jgi:hypothetical protein